MGRGGGSSSELLLQLILAGIGIQLSSVFICMLIVTFNLGSFGSFVTCPTFSLLLFALQLLLLYPLLLFLLLPLLISKNLSPFFFDF
jgi:hypothetical protein